MVKQSHYVPEKGDFIFLSFSPQAGHEQRGRRPALVISNTLFNEKTGMIIACPLTNTNRKHPLHVPVPKQSNLTGFVMVEQVKSLDYHSRQAQFAEKADQQTLAEVLAILDSCLY